MENIIEKQNTENINDYEKETVTQQTDLVEEKTEEKIEDEKLLILNSIEINSFEIKLEENNDTEKNNSMEQIPLISTENNTLLTAISNLVSNEENFNNFLKKNNININDNDLKKILKILNKLNVISENNSLFNLLIQEVTKSFLNDYIELYDIPLFVKSVFDNINLKLNKLSDDNISELIKVIIILLVEFKVIKINNYNDKLLLKIIDSSLILLKSNIKHKFRRFKWLSFF